MKKKKKVEREEYFLLSFAIESLVGVSAARPHVHLLSTTEYKYILDMYSGTYCTEYLLRMYSEYICTAFQCSMYSCT
jgi:hypothetical protein